MTFRHVLVAVNGSSQSEEALRRAASIVRTTGAQLTVIGVKEAAPIFAAGAQWPVDGIDRAVDEAVDAARHMGIEAGKQVLSGYPAEAILRWCEEHDCDLIVIGSSDMGVGSVGRTTDKVVDLAPCAVLVAR
jgi:nucleotide-binding universal stress UspA family protein